MKYLPVLAPLLALSAAAPAFADAPAATQDDVYKALSLGDRVQITFRSGNTVSGRLVPSPLSPQAKAKDAPRVALASGPFHLLYFRDEKDQSCEAQDLIFQVWLKRHADGKIETIQKGSKPELWQLYNIEGTPGLVFQDRGSGRTLTAMGVQNESKLDELLTRLRSKGGTEGERPDYARDRTLTIDMSWEYPGLNGTMTVDKKEIREIRKLQNLDPKTLAEVEKEKKKVQAELEKQNLELRRAAIERDKAAEAEIEARRKTEEEGAASRGEEGDLKAKLEKIRKWRELLTKFPPSVWSEKKLEDIARKNQSRLPITPEEREFMLSVADWKEAVAANEAARKEIEDKKKKGERPPEEKK